MFYDNYVNLCNSINKAPTAVVVELGYKRSAVTRWKNGSMPTDATLHKIANYFGVSLDDLVGKTAVRNPQEPKKEEIDDHDIKYALFGTTDIDDETYESVKNFAKFAAEQKRKKREGR